MDIQKLGLTHSSVLLAFAAALAIWPSSVQKARVITFKKALSIQTSKADPPRLAFDDLHENDFKKTSDWDLLKNRQGYPLVVGDQLPRLSGQNPTKVLRNKKIVLQPMTFNQQDMQKHEETMSWIESLSATEQKRVLAAQDKNSILDEDWRIPTFRELAAQKIEEVKQEMQRNQSEPQSGQVVVQAILPDGDRVTPEAVRTADVQIRPQSDVPAVQGQIEIRGLPSGQPQWQIRVARYEGGVKKEDGIFDTKTSTFSMNTSELSGTLVAQMVDSHSGDVIGEGRYRLSEASLAKDQRKPKITVAALNNHILASFGSFYGDPQKLTRMPGGKTKAIAANVLFASLGQEGRTDKSGQYVFEQVQNGSWGILRTEAKGYYPGIHLVQSGQEKQWPLFTESFVQALKQIIQDQSLKSEVPETGSVVWGQVLQNGKAVAGAEVVAEGLENYKAIYFNSMLLPDPQLKSTGENGFFVFVHLPPGLHSLMAHFGLSYFSHGNVIVDDDTISVAQLEGSLFTEKAILKVFDAFSGQARIASVELQSLPAALEVQGFAEINLSPIQRISFMKVVPQDSAYAESLQIYEDHEDSVHIPLVKTDWLQSLMMGNRISAQPETGTIIGFVPGNDFEAYLGHLENFPTDQIVYFDSQGQRTQKGSAGGGFAIFNVPPGIQSIVIAHSKGQLLQTQVAPVDGSGLVILKFK